MSACLFLALRVGLGLGVGLGVGLGLWVGLRVTLGLDQVLLPNFRLQLVIKVFYSSMSMSNKSSICTKELYEAA